jgi:sulfite reductase alpha subunit-like flavoprotein
VQTSDRVRPGNCFAPFHWNDEQGEYLTVNAVTNDAVDADSLQPEFKASAVALRRIAVEPAAPAETPPAAVPVASGSGTGHPLARMLGLDTAAAPMLSDTERIYLGGYLAALDSLPVQGLPVLPESAPLARGSRLWIDGLLAGMYSRTAGATTPDAKPAAAQAEPRPVLVLWASQTGTAEELAAEAAEQLSESGCAPRLMEMNSCELTDLTGDALVITSTFGDGGPPDNGAEFWDLLSGSTIRLTELRYAVFAIGDSSYDDFCGHGRKLDELFAKYGATKLLARVDSEPDHSELSARWLEDVRGALTAEPDGSGTHGGGHGRPEPGGAGSGRGGTDIANPLPSNDIGGQGAPCRVDVLDSAHARTVSPSPKPPPAAPAFTRNAPTAAPLIRNELLSRPGSAKEVRQFGFDLTDLDATYEVGDSLGVWPANDAAMVAQWLDAAGLDPRHPTGIDDREVPLEQALRTHYDITRISSDLLNFVAAHNPSPQLAKLLRRDNRTELDGYLWDRQAVDVLHDFPVRADPVDWLGTLKKLQPRQYSISSSPLVDPHEVQLTVGVVRYGDPAAPRGGVCSTFLADRGDEARIPIFLQRAPHFRPPLDPNAPMIMIGPGTGIAPFRGFLHERRALGCRGRNWLLFGDQHAADNFYYRTELEDMFRDGFLTRLDLAFSRDQRERVYVQHRMLEHGAELWSWLQSGAHIYVCGDAARMARDVDQTLLTIARIHGNLTPEAATAYKKQLTTDKRYVRDIY